MSNLSELLPAGAGAKSASFVASGTLGSGVTVALNSNGTVTAVSGAADGVGSSAVFETAATSYIEPVFDSNANKMVMLYNDNGNTNYGTAIVGTVSGSSISFGTPVVFESADSSYITACFDSANNKIVVCYVDVGNSSFGTSVVGTVSGTSISFGTPVVFESASTTNCSIVFDSNSNKVVICYKDLGNSNQGTAIVGTVSGTSVSFGTASVFETGNTEETVAAFDSTLNKIVVAYRDVTNSHYGTAAIGTVSGTSISFGTPVVFSSSGVITEISIAYDTTNNRSVIAYKDSGNLSYGTAIVGTVSGTSISFGTPVVFNSASTGQSTTSFDSSVGKVCIAYKDQGNLSYGTVITGTVSGTSISFGDPLIFENTGTCDNPAIEFDSTSEKMVIGWRAVGNSNYGTSIVFTVGSTNSADFIGITDQAIADTATGAVIVQGGVSDKVTGLTANTDYYVQTDGTISTTVSTVPAGRALSSTSILLEG